MSDTYRLLVAKNLGEHEMEKRRRRGGAQQHGEVGMMRSGEGRSRSADESMVIAAMHAQAWRFTGADYTQGSVPQLLTYAMEYVRTPAPWEISLEHTTSGRTLFRVNADGSVIAYLRTGAREVWPAGTIPARLLPMIGAHQGAGVSVWAQLLGGVEVPAVDDDNGPALIVVRSTLAGVEAAKRYSAKAGAILLVADAAGKLPPEVRRAVRVLQGAAPVIPVPWLPALRGMISVPENAAIKKAAAKVAAAVREQWRETP